MTRLMETRLQTSLWVSSSAFGERVLVSIGVPVRKMVPIHLFALFRFALSHHTISLFRPSKNNDGAHLLFLTFEPGACLTLLLHPSVTKSATVRMPT